MMIGVFMPLEKEINAANVTITYSGGIRLPGASTKVGKFKVNGQRAFCLQHTQLHPPSGTTMSSSPYTNKRIAKTLYYGWAGVKPWSGFKAGSQSGVSWSTAEHGIVLTSLLLSCYYNGDSPGSYSYIRGFSAFKRYIESRPNVINDRVAFSKTKLTAKWNTTLKLQKTDSVKIKGDKGSKISFTIPKGVTMINAGTGGKQTGRVTAKVGKTYYFTAKENVTGIYKTGAVGKNWKFQPLVFKKAGGGVQNLSKGDKIIDPALKTSLEIKWLSLGSVKVIKKSESGKLVAGAKFSITGNGITKTGTTGSKGEYIFTQIAPGKYKISEVSVPSPYLLDKTPKNLTVAINKVTSVTFTNKYARGKFTLVKKDTKGKTLKGAKFRIWSEGNDLEGNPIKFDKEFTTDEGGKITVTGLKLGKYNYQEVEAPDGFACDKNTYGFTLSYKDQNTSVIKERVSKTDKQVIFYKTDENGKILSGGKFVVVDKDGNIIEKFDGHTSVDEAKGIPLSGLIEGKEYILKELEPPKGYGIAKDIKFTVKKDGENQKIVMKDEKSEIKTTALDSDTKDHISNADEDIIIEDEVEYKNLIPGKEYEMSGMLMDKESGKPLKDDSGNIIKGYSKFKAKAGNGKVKIIFKLKGKTLVGKTTVVFETLKSEGKKIAIHADIKDEGQSVHFPKIKTKANVSKDIKTVKDVVTYKNLIPGKKYTMTGWLVNKNTGKKIVGSERGKEFTPKYKDGEVTITLSTQNTENTNCCI